MDLQSITALIGCSSSSARNYVKQLADAQLVVKSRNKGSKGGGFEGSGFKLVADVVAIRNFLSNLVQLKQEEKTSAIPFRQMRGTRAGANYRHMLSNEVNVVLNARDVPARRDPLVAALFGP